MHVVVREVVRHDRRGRIADPQVDGEQQLTRREVDVHSHYPYYPRRIRHAVDTSYSIETLLYRPTVGFTVKLAHKIRVVQNGNLQSYLAYVVVALVLALLWMGQVKV